MSPESLHELFSYVCGQVNVWSPGGAALPMCQRCTGLYAGGVYAALVIAIFRPRPSSKIRWAHGIAMLLMAPFGYHLIPQSAVWRTLTGQLFACGLVYYLFLNPGDWWGLWRDGIRLPVYAACMLAGMPLLLIGLEYGSPVTARWIGLVGAAGLALYALLIVTNFYVFVRFGAEHWRRTRAA